MRSQFFKTISLLFTFLFCLNNSANAALITTEFSELVGNQGSVDINLTLASGENFNGFSLFFSEDLFANLNIVFSPDNWDSIVLQPDALLGAGLFDSFNPAGLITGVARVSFTYLSDLPFASLAYDFYNADFAVVESGSSTNVTTTVSVPESSSIMLLMFGVIALFLRNRMCKTTITAARFSFTKNEQVTA